MRIISGAAGSRRIDVPKFVTRPSTDRLREALFSILVNRLEGACVLDLFAGSGALGLEALSRGASSAVFVDENRDAYRTVQSNLQKLGLKNGRVIRADVPDFLNTHRNQYDLLFADPPYCKSSGDRDFVMELLEHEQFPALMKEDALLIIEDDPSNCREEVSGWKLIDQRKYGSSGILFYQRS